MRLATLLFALLLATVPVWAIGPTTMTYQAIFTDSQGEVMADGVYNIGFHIFTGPVGGPPIWSEWQDVTVTNGVFEVTLGIIMPLSPAFFPPAGAWLGLSYNGDFLNPRQFMTAVPYAFVACWADSARVAGNVSTGGFSQLLNTDNEVSNSPTNFASSSFTLNANSAVTFFATAIVEDDEDSEGVLWRGRLELLDNTGTVMASSQEVKEVAPGDLFFQTLASVPAGTYSLRLVLWTTDEAATVWVEHIDFGANWVPMTVPGR